jgi:hypothetical protein
MQPETYPFVLPIICGYVGSSMLQVEEQLLHIVLISRCSYHRAGPNFRRGVDHLGESAIEVETEIMLLSHSEVCSFRMLRGSIPLIWRTIQGDGEALPKLDLRDSASDSSSDAMRLHLDKIASTYGPHISIIDLLDTHRPDYAELGKIFELSLMKLQKSYLSYHHMSKSLFDKKVWADLLKDITPDFRKQGFFNAHLDDVNSMPHLIQRGIFR